MKKKLLTILFLFITVFSFTQINNKIAPAFRYMLLHPLNSETEVNYPTLYKVPTVDFIDAKTGLYQKGYMCIIYTKNPETLRFRGIAMQSVLPNFVTALVSLNQIIELSYLEDIKYIASPKVVMPNNDISVGSSGASLLHSGNLNNTIYKGDGVIVGVFDTGIDWDHPDFRNPSDQTKSRILRIWDQTISPISGEISPTGFSYGVEYTQAHLNDELDGTPTGYVREKDLNGHGTHVTGTAAGNGAALSTKKYMGIAPNADIVVVKGGNGSFNESDIINGLTYFQNVANTFGKPIVVNMSIGGQDGAHDGSNAEEVAVDNFSNAASGRVVVIAAGNDNGTAIHKQISIAANGSGNIVVNVPTASGSSATDVFQFTMYANDASNLNVVITTPNGGTVTANAGQSINQSVLSNAATIYLDNVIDAASGDRMVNVYVARNTTTANPSGSWTIALSNTTSSSLILDGWLNYKGANFSLTTVSGSDNNYLVGSPGTATSAITVASYMAKLDWFSTSTTAAGGYAYSNAQQDNISNFSSIGPRRDNVQKPNIAANGQAVVSCLASDAGIAVSSNTIVVQGLYRAIQGTSMATPEVTGCVALLLQVKPTATFGQIRNAITTTATKDNFTTANTNAIWGSGKIDVFKAASSLATCTTFKRVTLSYDSSTTSANNGTLLLSSSKAATRFTPTITGKLGGVYFKTGTTVTLSSFTVEVRTSASGIPSTLLGSMSITPSSVSRFSWNYYDLSSLNINVTNGIDYFIVLVPGISDSWALGFESLSVSGRSFTNNGSSWAAANDLRIRTVIFDNTVPTSSSITNVSICSGSNYSFNGTNFNTAGTYIAHLTNAAGCDSAASLVLILKTNYTISASAASNGNISPSGVTNVCTGNNQTFTITANSGYSIGDVLVDGISKGAIGSFTFGNVIANHTISATFASNCIPNSSTTNASICNGSSYSFNGINYTTAGTYITHLTNIGGCDSAATLILTTKVSPAIGTSSSVATFCAIGATKNITNSNTNGGGIWSSNNSTVATVATVSGASGIITSASNGTAIITYTKTGSNGCTASASATIVVAVVPTPNNISGANSICKAAITALSSTTNGGIWTSLNNAATINSSGVIAGANAGTAVINYTVLNSSGCSAFTSYNVTINAIPNIPSIGYAAGTANPQTGASGAFCINRTFTVVGTPTGGLWSSTGVLTVGATTGIVNTNTLAGTGSLTYTITTNGCSNSRTISGTVAVCAARQSLVNSQSSMKNDIVMFPNPARSVVSFQVKTLIGAGIIVVTDLYGKQVKIQSLSMGTNTIDVSKLAKGMYFVRLITSEETSTKKLVVE